MLALLSLGPLSAAGQSPEEGSPAPDPAAGTPAETTQSPGTAALKSLVLPGWGQAGNDQWLKSGLFLGAYGGLLAWGVSLNQDKQAAEGSLVAAPDSLKGYWQGEVDRLANDRNAKFWFAGATLLLSVVDAYVDAHLRGFDDRIDAQVGWRPDQGGALSVALRTRWD